MLIEDKNIIRAVRNIIINDGIKKGCVYTSGDYSFDDVYYSSTGSIGVKEYTVNYYIDMDEGIEDKYWGAVTEIEVFQFLREEKIDTILNNENL